MKSLKKKLKKVLICILILFTLNNFFVGSLSGTMNCVYAADAGNVVEGTINVLFNTVVGLLTWPLRIVALGVGMAFNKLTAAVAYIENDDTQAFASITPFDILFNKVKLVDINFFDIGEDEDSILYKFRTAIALWYYTMRTLASAILLCVLIYVGIRMALSTVTPEQKASYQKMLVDWVVSIAIIFLMQYIILFTIYVNDSLVSAIEGIGESIDISSSIDSLAAQGTKAMSVDAIAATVVFCMLVFQTFALFISYFNRMLKLAFLIIISPLITLTYAMDKMGDGKAQALNTWLKEFIFTVLIQPFHCIIYMTFGNVAFILLVDTGSGTLKAIACAIIAIICINFIKEGEKIVRKIFNFQDDDKQTSLAAGMAVATVAASKAKNVGKNTRKAVNSVRNLRKNTVPNLLRSAKVEALTIGRIISGQGEGKSTREIKSEVSTDVDNKKAEKEERKTREKYGVSTGNNQAEIDARATAILNANGSLTRTEAAAKARLEIAKEKRQSAKSDNFSKKHPVIKSARGKIKAVKSVIQQSETLRELGKLGKGYIAAGAGLALGSGVYGTTQNFSQSLMSGFATYRGTNEFFKNSSKTLRKDVDARLDSLGMSGKVDAANKINSILANASKYEEKDELDKIMKELEKALEKAGVSGKLKSNIRNTIERGAARDPRASVATLVNSALAANGITGEHLTADVMNHTNKLAEFTQEKGIYNTVKQSGDLGEDADTFISDVIKKYEGTGSINTNSVSSDASTSSKTNKEFLDEAVEITEGKQGRDTIYEAPDDAEVEEFIKDRTEKDLKEFYKTCEKEIDKTKQQLNREVSEIIKRELTARVNQIEAAKAKVQDKELDREVDRLRQEYTAAVNKASSATEQQARIEVDRELSKLQGQYDKYIEEANNHIGRTEMQGIKSESEIVAQKMALETDQADIMTLRRNLRNQNS